MNKSGSKQGISFIVLFEQTKWLMARIEQEFAFFIDCNDALLKCVLNILTVK